MVSLVKTTPEIDAYYKECMDLVKTLTIKHSISADLLNKHLSLKYPQLDIDYNNPKTWKYYLNISGQYHETDTVMRVTSLDTLEEIDFTVENLKLHTATKQAYLFGTRYYYLLLNKYKAQEQLILGILYPANIDEAVSAEDGRILAYPKNLVLEQEHSLIYELEIFIKHNISKHFCYGFSITDKYYASIYFVCLTMLLYAEVINIRMAKVKTYQAHDFHIRMYLGSFFGLDKYIKFLTKKQVFWLYKNILYLEKNAGTAENFETLIKQLMSERQMPVAEYSLRSLMEFDENLRPIIRARKRALDAANNNSEVSYITLDQFLELTAGDRSGNPQYLQDEQERIKLKIKNASTSIIQTKVIESDVVDYSNAVPMALAEVIFTQWFYMSWFGLLTTVITFEDPIDGSSRTLSALDAFIYYCYIYAKFYGGLTKLIPIFSLTRARLRNKPTLEKLLSYFTNEHKQDIKPVLIEVLERSPDVRKCTNSPDFLSICTSIYDERIYHWYLLSNTHDAMVRGCLELALKEFYTNYETIEVVSSQTPWVDWLASKNIPERTYTQEQTDQILDQIFKSVSSYDVDESLSVKNIQKALIEVLKKFISYTVQVIGTVNSSDVVLMHGPHLRLTDFDFYSKHSDELSEDLRVEAIDSSSKYTTAPVEVVSGLEISSTGSSSVQLNSPSVLMTMRQESVSALNIIENPLVLSISYEGMDSDFCAKTGLYFGEFLKTISPQDLDRLIRATS